MGEKLLRVEGLRVSFKNNEGYVQVVRGFDLEIEKGEIVGILGESGSGKTVSSMSIMRLLEDENSRVDSGRIEFKGRNLLGLKEEEMRKIRGREISYIFQDAASALNPFQRCGKQVGEVYRVHGNEVSSQKIIEVMKDVGIDNAELIYHMYPFQLSGGLNQRVMIAMSIASRPDILIADEPTTAIDASLQRKVLKLLKDINSKYGMSIIVITHDFNVAREICDRVLIMYGGLIMEEGRLEEMLDNPIHPYTKELLRCVKSLDDNDDKLYSLQGMPPDPRELGEECPFHYRCVNADEECLKEIPKLVEIGERKIRCIKCRGRNSNE